MGIRAIDEDSESAPYHIRPEDIDASKHFFSAFGQCEVEIVAKYVVLLCQKSGGWKAFTRESLDEFYRENGGLRERVFNCRASVPFHWLNEKLLVQRPDGKYCVTDLFIDRCFISSPKNKNS